MASDTTAPAATDHAATDPRAIIQSRPMRGTQVLIVGICALLLTFEGFDVLALSFSAPAIAREWGLGPGSVGMLFSAGLAGVGLGTLGFAPVADAFGRRPVIIFSSLMITIGMLLSTVTTSVLLFAATRVITGLGVGGLFAVTGVLIFEYTSAKARVLALGMNSVGFPIGAILGGSLAYLIIHSLGWRAVFAAGGLASAVLLPMIIWLLPESIDFLIERRPKNALARMNRLLQRLDIPPLVELPPNAAALGEKSAVLRVSFGTMLAAALPVSLAYLFGMFSFYFVLSWVPKLLTDIGHTERSGIGALTLINIGGIVGILGMGPLSNWLGVRRATTCSFIGMAIGIVVFGLVSKNPTLVTLICAPLGMAVYAMTVGLYAMAAAAFPTTLRTTGIGVSLTAGRIGSIVSPYVAGLLFAAHLTPLVVCALCAIPAVLAALSAMKANPAYSSGPAAAAP